MPRPLIRVVGAERTALTTPRRMAILISVEAAAITFPAGKVWDFFPAGKVSKIVIAGLGSMARRARPAAL